MSPERNTKRVWICNIHVIWPFISRHYILNLIENRTIWVYNPKRCAFKTFYLICYAIFLFFSTPFCLLSPFSQKLFFYIIVPSSPPRKSKYILLYNMIDWASNPSILAVTAGKGLDDRLYFFRECTDIIMSKTYA